MPNQKMHKAAAQHLQVITTARVAHRFTSANRLATGNAPQRHRGGSYVITVQEPLHLARRSCFLLRVS